MICPRMKIQRSLSALLVVPLCLFWSASGFSTLRVTRTRVASTPSPGDQLSSYYVPDAYAHRFDKEITTPYSINLMWINRSLNLNERYIYPSSSDLELNEKFLTPLYEWAKLNPGATVNIWYDSALSSEAAAVTTAFLINSHNQDNPLSAKVVLKDIRSLPQVRDNPEAFSPELPVFFQVDLLRMIAGIYEVTHEKKNYVYADFDIQAGDKSAIFSAAVNKQLHQYGFHMARKEDTAENSFQILSCANPHMLAAIQGVLIDLSIERAKYAVQNKDTAQKFQCDTQFGALVPSEMVYDTYSVVMRYFYDLEGYGKFLVCFPRSSRPHHKNYDLSNPEVRKELIERYYYYENSILFPFSIYCSTSTEVSSAELQMIKDSTPPCLYRNIPHTKGNWDQRSMQP
jgi:hypothetical protein